MAISKAPSKSVTTQQVASRVQSATALKNNGSVPKGSPASRMTSAAHKLSKNK